MSIASAVARLANLVAERAGSLSAWETALCEGLVKMPYWLTEGSLDVWDEGLRDVWAAGTQEDEPPRDSIGYMFERVWDLGSLNLYGAFDAPRSRSEYLDVVADLSRCLSVEIAPTDDVSRW